MDTTPVRYIFLDYDGTIIENAEGEFLKEYFSLLSKKSGIEFNQLFQLVMSSVEESIRNMQPNESLFEKFSKAISSKSEKPKEYWQNLFYDFYENEFDELSKIVKPNIELIELIKKTNKKVIFASNPLFPKIATHKRIQFAGLEPDMFFYIAHMENSTYAKPNPLFFQEILNKLNISPNECVMIGDSEFDMSSEKAGIKFVHIDEVEKWKPIF
ncbi:haloacid dehalogenase superfamily, subfamily IA, variant 3 with third motif having DD or ED/haloacid dehalogenase superfamily, subfamily IA, variant 1 with third motif having Dx(3-4)D or Dx(3-4)E [Fervidobacterium changbaicum]|uniref:HAD family hydrolase n=2 Tax=Fervidobacterium TaxID=2422 RepID=A0AAI8CLZ2_FERIS|nr:MULTISPECIES: HAD family hydrolase [Fervidobacterium]AMW33063.1 HAD family hydrolase [Fervidobacterium islandicum]QAV33107.1 HAD family hydrolase [Fervidobacterium changbaicum]SDH10396.1 haloacid dehalogenase superfamily, subfamily IA, variant 3 with third motif having DD or ED/haloacid dehalogenase superfamily, subfamily IA, variant 1 with third motif having Dx(3-4)D or Dx(3-4)E [Fervidobacterium changbaicum]